MRINNWSHKINYTGLTQEIIVSLRPNLNIEIFDSEEALIQYVTIWTNKLREIDELTKKERKMKFGHEYYGIDHFYKSADNLKMFFDIDKLKLNQRQFQELAKLVPQKTIFNKSNKFFSYNENLPKQKYRNHEIIPIVAVEWFSPDGKFTVIDGNNRLNTLEYQAMKNIPTYLFFFADAVKFYKSIFLSDWDAAFYFMHYEMFNIVNSDRKDAIKILRKPLYGIF